MARYCSRLAATVAAALALGAGDAAAAGGNYTFAGGTPAEQRQVRSALDASSFNWSLIPVEVVVHIDSVGVSYARPGHVWLDKDLLDAGRFAWATIQHEFAHQVDFFLFDATARRELQGRLGAAAWCGEVSGLPHGAYGCERFASTAAWAYWPVADNSYRPESRDDESASMRPAEFRALVVELLRARLGSSVAVEAKPTRATSSVKRKP